MIRATEHKILVNLTHSHSNHFIFRQIPGHYVKAKRNMDNMTELKKINKDCL